MKRIAVLAMCLLMLWACTVTAFAEDGGIYETARQLFDAWHSQGGVPNYVSGIWVTDENPENLTIGLVKGEAGEAGRQEILDLVKDDSTVTIVYQTYSRNYLWQIQDIIVHAYFEKGLGLVSAGVDEYENRLRLEVHRDYAENADTLEMIRLVTEQYGDAVCFSFVDTYPQLVEHSGVTLPPVPTRPVLGMMKPQNPSFSFALVVTFCVMVLSCFFLVDIRRRRILLLASDGTPVVVDDRPVSKKEIEETIRKAEVNPSAALDDRVMHSIQSDVINNG